ncbi:stage V sporulation protein G [Persephonella atlantica]|uniref:Stage V sporulation protein G n=1 Tax=Persephonella atlantica TaxID=2699429 RepID=A0ABS1GHB7_9AQUI|nr:SpoVG family protein [Persephonella atlantica]MBK3332326.1 stage V sporulation protein G [Persephonella atlantica]
MEITEVKIYPFDTSSIGGRVRAVADITINNTLVIKGIKVIESKHGGLFISFPKKVSSKGTYVDIVQSLDSEFTEKVRRAVVDKYKEIMGIT